MTPFTVTIPCSSPSCHATVTATVKSLHIIRVPCGGEKDDKGQVIRSCGWWYWIRPRGRGREVRVYEVEPWGPPATTIGRPQCQTKTTT